MATSGVRDTAIAVSSLIAQSLKKIQVGVGGETLAAEYISAGIDAYNSLIRRWAAKGIRLWLNETQSVTFVAGTTTYTLSPRILECYEAFRRAGTGSSINDTPIRIITKEEYERLPNKATAGAPFAVYINRLRTSTTASFYPVPTAANVTDSMVARLIVKRQIEDITSSTEDAEFPPEWSSALIWNGAVEMAPEFNKMPSPLVLNMAAESFSDLEGQDREGSVRFAPGPRR